MSVLNPAGSALLYSTYLGGASDEDSSGIAVNSQGEAYVIGYTMSTDFPVLNPMSAALFNGSYRECISSQICGSAFITKLTASGSLAYSTYFGGSVDTFPNAIALDGAGAVAVAGRWETSPLADSGAGSQFPPGGYQKAPSGIGAFVIKLSDAVGPGYSALSATNGASFQSGLTAGSIATLFGVGITASPGIVTASSLPLPTSLNGSFVSFNGQNAPLFAVANVNGGEQINFQVPPVGSSGAKIMIAGLNNTLGVPIAINLQAFQPGIFMVDGKRGAVQHANGQLVTPSNPAVKGEVVVVYATGLGPVTPDPGWGNPAAVTPLSYTNTVPTATVGGQAAQVQFSGLTPGFVGLNQVNIQVPQSVASGDQALVLTITIQQGAPGNMISFSSPPVTIAIQ